MEKNLNLRNVIAIALTFAFLVNILGPLPAYAHEFRLPAPGTMVALSPAFNPPLLKGLKVHPDDPFRFDFILDRGEGRLSNDDLKEESDKLIKYFLASLTIPEKDLWVNLSPYEKDRIIPESFGRTEMGRDLLAEDYMLKQITASLIYPEGENGKKFWKRIYEEAAEKFGTTDIPVNTFNKVWIVPEKAVVYENAKAGTSYVVESRLKVMLEEDYLALQKHTIVRKEMASVGSDIVREIVIPELTKEVNEGQNFAQLRQVYSSLILAAWYKKKIKDSILSQVYADKNKITGIVAMQGSETTEAIYQQYLQAFKKGVFNYIKEETDAVSQETVPRKYFSGGFFGPGIDHAMSITDHLDASAVLGTENDMLVQARFDNVVSDKAVTADGAEASVLGSLEKALRISSDEMKTRLYHSVMTMNDQRINITQYKNTPDEIAPFLRVGKFIIIDDMYFDRLGDDVKKYKFLIRKNRDMLEGDPWANEDMNYNTNNRGWNGYFIGVLASMAAYGDQMKGSSFIDFGAGFSGILAVAAQRLGAAEIVLIESNQRYMRQLKSNLTINNVPEDVLQLITKDFLRVKILNTKRRKVTFVLDLPSYGASSDLGELPHVLEILEDKKISLGLVSGGMESNYPKASSLLAPEFDVRMAIVIKGPVSNAEYLRRYTILIALPKEDAAMSSSVVKKRTLKIRTKDQRTQDQDKLYAILESRQATVAELEKDTGIPRSHIWDDLRLSRFDPVRQNIKWEHEERSPQEVEKDREAILELLKHRPYTRPELAAKRQRPRKQIEWDVDALIEEGKHQEIMKNVKLGKSIRPKEDVEMTPWVLEFFIRQGITSIKGLERITGFKRSVIENTIHRNAELKELRRVNATSGAKMVTDQILLKRLAIFKRLLGYKRSGELLFTPAQAFVLTMDCNLSMEEDIYEKIDWLMAQEISKGVPFFTGNEIMRVISSRQSLGMISGMAVFLRQKKYQDGRPLFNGNYVSLIIFGKHTTREIDELIQFLDSKENGDKKFSGSQISRILASRMDMHAKKAVIGYLCRQKEYNEGNIARIMSRNISLNDIQRLDEFLRKEIIFTGFSMSGIIYKNAPVDEKIKFLKFLLAQRDGDNERLFNGFDIERIVINTASWKEKKDRIQYFLDQKNTQGKAIFEGGDIRWAIEHYKDFNKPVFEAILNIFKETDVENRQALYWTVRAKAYKAFIEEWLSRDFKELPDQAKKVIYGLISNTETEGTGQAFTTQLDGHHLEGLLGVLFKAEQLQDVRRKMAARQERLNSIFESIDGRTLMDGDEDIIRNLIMSPDIEHRKIIIGKISQSLNGLLAKMHNAYNGDGDIIFWGSLKRYNWLRPDASLANLKMNMRFVLFHKKVGRSISHLFQLSSRERKLLQVINSLRRMKSMDDQSITRRLTQQGYSRQFIAQGLQGFILMSLDRTVSDIDKRTGHDFISLDDLAPGYFTDTTREPFDEYEGSKGDKETEDALVMVQDKMERVLAANLLDALTAWLAKIHASTELRMKVNQAAEHKMIGFKVNEHIVSGSDAKDYFIESGDLIEILLPFSIFDKAQISQPKGGIDLDPNKMDLQLRNAGQDIKFHIDPAQLQELQNAPGFTPVIISIQPMKDLRGFLEVQ